jgi:hypothetical protein
VPLTLVGMALVVCGVLASVLYSRRREKLVAELEVTRA